MSVEINRRSRSPKFPSHSVDEAISYAYKIYEEVHLSPVDSLTALKLMGFSGKSGASAAALGSVRQYGLVDGTGENTRVSDFALKIFEPQDNFERDKAIAEATRKPSVFVSILDRFQNRIPSADEPVRAFLIRELGFSKKGADDCLKSLRYSLAYADMSESNIVESSTNDLEFISNQPLSNSEMEVAPPTRADVGQSANKTLQIPLTKQCHASLILEGDVTLKAIENLMKHIELMKDVWPEEEE